MMDAAKAAGMSDPDKNSLFQRRWVEASLLRHHIKQPRQRRQMTSWRSLGWNFCTSGGGCVAR